MVLASRLPAAAKLTVVLTSRCDLVTEALAQRFHRGAFYADCNMNDSRWCLTK